MVRGLSRIRLCHMSFDSPVRRNQTFASANIARDSKAFDQSYYSSMNRHACNIIGCKKCSVDGW